MQDVIQQLVAAVIQYLPANVWDWIVLLFQLATGVMAVAAALVKLIAVIAKVTPSTKDDEFASRAQVILSHISAFLDKISLGLTAEQARRGAATAATKPNA